MINQKESKQVRMESWLVELLSRDMKTKAKNKDQPTRSYKKNNRKIKYNKKIKAMRNIAPTMDQYSRNGQMGDTDHQFAMSC